MSTIISTVLFNKSHDLFYKLNLIKLPLIFVIHFNAIKEGIIMKTNHTVRISDDIWKVAKNSGINISKFLETQLQEQLKITLDNKNNTDNIYQEKVNSITRDGVVTAYGLNRVSNETGIDYGTLRTYCAENDIMIKRD